MPRSLLIAKAVLLLGVVCIFPATAQLGASSIEKLSLTIDNRADQPIRCSIVYAHFVSESTSLIYEATTLHFDRHTGSGALSEQRSGRAMMLENIICGTNQAWQETVSEILLLPMRDSAVRNFVASCQFELEFRCDISEGSP